MCCLFAKSLLAKRVRLDFNRGTGRQSLCRISRNRIDYIICYQSFTLFYTYRNFSFSFFFCIFINRSAHYNNLQKQEEEEEHLKNTNKSNNNNNSGNENKNPTNIKENVKKDDLKLNSQKSAENSNQLPKIQKVELNNTKPAKSIATKIIAADNKAKITTTPKIIAPPQAKTLARKLSNLPNIVPKHLSTQSSNERPLKCLETLAQKAGITFDDQFDTNNSLNHSTQSPYKMDKGQTQAQQVATQSMPIQISQEQLQQLQQQYQLQAFGGGASIQVKQEFPQQTITAEQLKQQLQEQQNQTHQVQQMQLIDATASPQHQATANAAAMGIKYVGGKYRLDSQPLISQFLPKWNQYSNAFFNFLLFT